MNILRLLSASRAALENDDTDFLDSIAKPFGIETGRLEDFLWCLREFEASATADGFLQGVELPTVSGWIEAMHVNQFVEEMRCQTTNRETMTGMEATGKSAGP